MQPSAMETNNSSSIEDRVYFIPILHAQIVELKAAIANTINYLRVCCVQLFFLAEEWAHFIPIYVCKSMN